MTVGNRTAVAQLPSKTAVVAEVGQTYISNTELTDGRQALLVDPGSYNNLSGAPWSRRTAILAGRNGFKATQKRRGRPLQVSGVGKDAQTCSYDCNLPIALKTIDNRGIPATFVTPTVDDHALPALLGLKTLMEQRAIMDFANLHLAFQGPGDSKIDYCPGTDVFQMFQAPSGHLMLPCCEYQATRSTPSSSSSSELVLHAQAPQNN